MTIDYLQVVEELQKKNLFDIQKELTKQRRTRTLIMSMLILSLIFTFIFGTLENPFTYTLSNIGNFFHYRLLFIIWAIVSGIAIEITLITLIRLEHYTDLKTYIFIYLATFFLIATGLIPALKDVYPFWHWMHLTTSILLALCYTVSVVPFSLWISKENPRLRRNIAIWLITIWIGSILMIILYQHSAMFEIWFFTTMILFLLYLSLVLFEEKIIKMSIKLMTNEKDLNQAIEKIFIDLEKATKISKKKNKKKSSK